MDFKNSILIMTSNLGSHVIIKLSQIDPAEMRKQVDTLLRQQFKPEFLNRVDEIITFHDLGREELLQIVDIQVNRLARRLGRKQAQDHPHKRGQAFSD